MSIEILLNFEDLSFFMSYTRECVNGISKVLLAVGISVYLFSYVLETKKGHDIYNSIEKFVSNLIVGENQNSIENKLE